VARKKRERNNTHNFISSPDVETKEPHNAARKNYIANGTRVIKSAKNLHAEKSRGKRFAAHSAAVSEDTVH
jgi:hypothetical protein